MNRSILIVICDFLLVSLLAFSTVDINKVAEEGRTTPQMRVEVATNQPAETDKDLAAVLRVALEEEQRRREMLLSELSRTRETATEREKQAQRLQQQLQSREQESQRLQQQQGSLQQQFTAAQTNIQNLSKQLEATTTDAAVSRDKLAELEAELKKRAEEAAAMQQRMAQLAQSNQAVLSERQKLASQLEVAEVEKRNAVEQATRMQEQVKVEREEKAKLAEGVQALASKSGELTQEIRENRPLTPNTIFNEFYTNRVQARFLASRSTLLGNNRNRDTGTVLLTDGPNTFAVCHIDETPLTLWNPGTDWDRLTGTLVRDNAQVAARSLAFHLDDPRVIMIPITAAEARQLGGKIYQISPRPFAFQDAVLVGAAESYYGECKFEIEANTPGYLKLDRSVLKGLFGRFNPSRGDLVFSKQGELLGIMVNNTYCLMLRAFDTAATIRFGEDVREQHTGATLSALYGMVVGLPPRLQ